MEPEATKSTNRFSEFGEVSASEMTFKIGSGIWVFDGDTVGENGWQVQ